MWFAKKKPFENKVGLSAAKVEQLQTRLKGLEEFGDDFCVAVLRYLLDDGPDAVLGELAGKVRPAKKLALVSSSEMGHVGDEAGWTGFFASIDPVPIEFYLRLAKLFEAAAKQLPRDRFFCQTQRDVPLWLEVLLQEATGTHARVWSSEDKSKIAITAQLIEGLLAADGLSIEPFLSLAFVVTKDYVFAKRRQVVMAIADMGSLFVKNREIVAKFLSSGNAESRVTAVENLAMAETPIDAFFEELCAAGVDSSKQLREAAEGLLRRKPELAQPILERYAIEGSRAEREYAVRLLARLLRGPSEAFLRTRLEYEKSAPVREVIMTALSQATTQAVEPDLTPPPRTPIDLHPPMTQALRDAIQAVVDEFNRITEKHNRDFAAATTTQRHVYPNSVLRTLTSAEADDLCRRLEHGGDLQKFGADSIIDTGRVAHSSEPTGAYRAFLEHPDTHLIHVLRWFVLVKLIREHRGEKVIFWAAFPQLDVFRQSHAPACSLLDVDEAVRSLGLGDDLLLDSILESYHDPADWESEAVWPFYLSRLPKLLEAFDPPSSNDWMAKYNQERRREAMLRVLTKFPAVPAALVGKLWDMAIGTNKADRIRAQSVVVKLPDLQERLAQALASGNYATRSAVAEWLGRLGDRQGVEPLRAAAKKEKQDAAIDEMLTALERLGAPIDEFLDRDRLMVDAEKGLRKGLPEALAWFPWNGLPSVHWHDTGRAVPPEVVRWLIVQSFKLKSAEAGPLLRRYGGMLNPQERSELASFVLSAWLNQDLKRKYTDAEARNAARQQAAAHFQRWGGTQYAGNSTQQQMEDQIFANLQRECGSAAAEKGILAVVGACGDEAIVGPVAKYLKEWYGYRAAQCKALIAMLSAVDRPTALQYLLSISNRFRTKGIREEAEKFVQLLAERKGWTLDELADRTMPTAGFDDDGRLELDFGSRRFTLRVNDQLECVLSDEEGKILKNLPAPRKDDDEASAAAAKKTFSAAKSDLKKFASSQSTRLYEAMCTERVWTGADWKTYFLGHPLMRILCRRVVWAVFDKDDAASGVFRPLEDGTLTDVDDSRFELPDDARIRIANSCRLTSDVAAAWVRHLHDYEVPSLFVQFGREGYALPEDKRKAKSIADFKGYMVEAFRLRGLATKFGYVRGQTQDGGWFFDYTKLFPGLGLEVELSFSGNGLPEENRMVALAELSFQKKSGAANQFGGRPSLALTDVPGVLLSECYNDLRTIAAAGTGFDPDWETKLNG